MEKITVKEFWRKAVDEKTKKVHKEIDKFMDELYRDMESMLEEKNAKQKT